MAVLLNLKFLVVEEDRDISERLDTKVVLRLLIPLNKLEMFQAKCLEIIWLPNNLAKKVSQLIAFIL